MLSFDEQVKVILEWYKKTPEKEQLAFKNIAKENLIGYHHTLGRLIRNHFELWQNEWVPEIKDGIDYSPNHPDAISMRLIEAVWDKIQNT